ncbi:MmcQ/YjbR family DNA-binding protein [Sphingomonas alpina]|uniref:MmcQ/YjbR family DNA-binding protein n=1 Tax=Sphingomonas alpina TaxID=653931 RepID=A0A7H0LP32_9SPHN|nr:MmcQ/YjbR family DNA-binding protein [Sphingomonas alpina]QNQ11435.1 MmcQ/YjbR family DNA-binding protein [Sphingomonas alpina]
MSLDWDSVTAFALALPDTGISTSYGSPAVKIVSNGRAFIHTGREAGSFVLAIDQDTKEMLIETDPDSFWQTPHYHGWPGLLVRYGSSDPERVHAMIERAHDWAAAKPEVKPRKAKQ